MIECFVKELRSIADIIYFDVANAFDIVSHQRLLDKLKSYGVRTVSMGRF